MELVEEGSGSDCVEDLVCFGEGVDVGVKPVEVSVETLAGGAFGEELVDNGVDEGIWGGGVLRKRALTSLSHGMLRVREVN